LRTSSSKNQLTLTLQRANFFQAQLIQLQDDAGSFRKPEIRKLIARKPIDYLIYFIKRPSSGFPDDFIWPSELQHRLVTLFGILAKGLLPPFGIESDSAQDIELYLRHSMSVIRASLDNASSKKDPFGAGKALGNLVRMALTFAGYSMSTIPA
jgi:hypothetical protein